jgi:hypothetical protein
MDSQVNQVDFRCGGYLGRIPTSSSTPENHHILKWNDLLLFMLNYYYYQQAITCFNFSQYMLSLLKIAIHLLYLTFISCRQVTTSSNPLATKSLPTLGFPLLLTNCLGHGPWERWYLSVLRQKERDVKRGRMRERSGKRGRTRARRVKSWSTLTGDSLQRSV